jgi:hypothetical protein
LAPSWREDQSKAPSRLSAGRGDEGGCCSPGRVNVKRLRFELKAAREQQAAAREARPIISRTGPDLGRLLEGASAADVPARQPTKLGFVSNLKNAKTLGLTMPPSLLARADEVIE